MAVEEVNLKTKEDPSARLYARIRKHDDILREHFSKINNGDRAYEIRRLLNKAILAEREDNKI